MNSRVGEAEKKRGEQEPYDISKTEAKLQSAEEKKAALIKETQGKAAAEVAKVSFPSTILRFHSLLVDVSTQLSRSQQMFAESINLSRLRISQRRKRRSFKTWMTTSRPRWLLQKSVG